MSSGQSSDRTKTDEPPLDRGEDTSLTRLAATDNKEQKSEETRTTDEQQPDNSDFFHVSSLKGKEQKVSREKVGENESSILTQDVSPPVAEVETLLASCEATNDKDRVGLDNDSRLSWDISDGVDDNIKNNKEGCPNKSNNNNRDDFDNTNCEVKNGNKILSFGDDAYGSNVDIKNNNKSLAFNDDGSSGIDNKNESSSSSNKADKSTFESVTSESAVKTNLHFGQSPQLCFHQSDQENIVDAIKNNTMEERQEIVKSEEASIVKGNDDRKSEIVEVSRNLFDPYACTESTEVLDSRFRPPGFWILTFWIPVSTILDPSLQFKPKTLYFRLCSSVFWQSRLFFIHSSLCDFQNFFKKLFRLSASGFWILNF